MLRLHVKLDFPQPRPVGRAVELIRQGGLVVFPTDFTYALGCALSDKKGAEAVRRLKGLPPGHRLSFICSDLSQAAEFAVIENRNHRILRHHLPGCYTFVLPATRLVPRLVQGKAHGTVGIRIPQSPVAKTLVETLGEPLLATTVPVHAPDASEFVNDPDEIVAQFGHGLAALLDGGVLYGEPSTIVDLTGAEPVVLRQGGGDTSWL